MKARILVVDDNPGDLSLIRLIFAEEGAEEFELVCEACPRHALEIVETLKPDLILLDVCMPINGFEVLAELKRRHIVTRVIMHSGLYSDLDTAVRCIREGACDFFVKDSAKVVTRVKRALVLGTTLNVSVSETTPIVDQLIADAKRIQSENMALIKENKLLKAKSRISEVATKVVYVGISVLAILGLRIMSVTSDTVTLTIAFVLLTMLLLIPMDRLHKLRIGRKSGEILIKH